MGLVAVFHFKTSFHRNHLMFLKINDDAMAGAHDSRGRRRCGSFSDILKDTEGQVPFRDGDRVCYPP